MTTPTTPSAFLKFTKKIINASIVISVYIPIYWLWFQILPSNKILNIKFGYTMMFASGFISAFFLLFTYGLVFYGLDD